MTAPTISVIIPLYNKEHEIHRTLTSVLQQSLAPLEIIVVDDGSKDRGADLVEAFRSPLVRLIRQPNGGVCVARNRGVAASRGEYIAFLDADDEWQPDFLKEVAALIGEYPGCGLYTTAFNIISHEGSFPAPTPTRRGIVDNFFRDSAHRYIAIPSASCLPRTVFDRVGGFPEGMKIGEDLYLWIKVARDHKVCFSPRRLVNYSRVAENRSATAYTPEHTAHSFTELLRDDAPDEEREFIARAALGKALILSAKGDTDYARRAAATFSYTRTYSRTLRKVRILNALPPSLRPAVLAFYNRMAWLIARKGL